MSRLTRPPRLLFVANVAWFFASHRLPVARAARDHGYDVHVAAGAEGAEALVRAGLSFHPLPIDRGWAGVGADWNLYRSLLTLYRGLAPDLVHHVTIKPVLYGSLAARRARVPWIVNAVTGLATLHLAEGGLAAVRRRAVQQLLRLGCDRPNCRTVFQNLEDRETYERARIVRRDHTVLIPGSGVDLDVFQPSVEPEGVPVVVLPARMIYHKGVGEFVGAARLLRDRNVSARFALVGPLDPDNESAIPADVLKTWLAEGAVEWWGRCEDMAHVFAEASVVCLPSYREGMSKALMEAAAAGRPVVTTDVPGCRECVEAGRTGLLVPVRDVTALAAALEVLLRDAPLRTAFGVQGRRLAERAFGVRQVIDRHIDLYRSLLAR